MEKTLNQTSESAQKTNEILSVENSKNDETVIKTYSFDEALIEATKYFKGDELAANVWINKYALKDWCFFKMYFKTVFKVFVHTPKILKYRNSVEKSTLLKKSKLTPLKY